MGLCKLKYVDEEIAKRKLVVEEYATHLCDVEDIQINPIQEGVQPDYAYFPIVFDALAENGIRARKYFYPLTNTFDCFHEKFDDDKTPVALHISEMVLMLPLYADLTIEDVNRICKTILECKK